MFVTVVSHQLKHWKQAFLLTFHFFCSVHGISIRWCRCYWTVLMISYFSLRASGGGGGNFIMSRFWAVITTSLFDSFIWILINKVQTEGRPHFSKHQHPLLTILSLFSIKLFNWNIVECGCKMMLFWDILYFSQIRIPDPCFSWLMPG